MARVADTPEMQRAKGSPGKRSTKAMRDREAQVKRLTELLTPSATGQEVPPPLYLLERGFEVALAVWHRLAPELQRTHRLPIESRETFAIYCTNYAEWLETQSDINEKGRTQRVKAIAGGAMERDRPVVRHRQQAFDNLLKLSSSFGLTPSDMYSLFKNQAMAAQNNPGLFDMPNGKRPAEPTDDAAPVAHVSVIGSSSRYKSSPPLQ